MTTGPDLRAERTAAGVTLNDVARGMHLSRMTVWRYETIAVVPDEIAARYRAALAERVAR